MKQQYADVILALAFGSSLSYIVPMSMAGSIRPGCRVRVPLGRKKHYTGIVVRLYDTPPGGFVLKEIAGLMDEYPVVNAIQLEFWQWLAGYYLCTPGEVMKAALPAGLKASSPKLPKTKTFLSLQPFLSEDSEVLDCRMAELSRAKKQQEALSAFLRLSQKQAKSSLKGVFKEKLLESTGLNPAILKALIQKDILLATEVEIETESIEPDAIIKAKELNQDQQMAIESIRQEWAGSQKVCLLHGVTSSGKTEIYIHLIRDCLAQGKQVLYLLPEIALTTQLTERLRNIFGNRLGVYHSACTDNERTALWNKLLSDQPYDLILGVRSSIFLPFRNLGLVIVDEEHENSYKQQDPAPRYHARNAAIVLAGLSGAKTLLGTATPCIESYYNCQTGKYKLVELSSRYLDLQLPEVLAVNTRDLRRKKKMKSLLSPLLIEKMRETLEAGKQIMLFRNRRAYAPLLECPACGWVPRCSRCDVSLAFHKQGSGLRCHYCGRDYPKPQVCPSCGNVDLELRGYGTEKVEEEVQCLFPEIRIARMDSDTMRNRKAYEKLIADFEQHKTDVLIGTQMLTKGLDFDRLQLVGILNADSMLNFPDFRAHEHAFQLMTQVSGRAGRKTGRGMVIIQTTDPQHPVVQYVLDNDYRSLYQKECQERSSYAYPPFSRMIEVFLRYRDESALEKASSFFAELLNQKLEGSVFGPVPPVVSRVKGIYIQKIILKIRPEISLKAAKDYLCQVRDLLYKNKIYRQIQVYFDVDPL